jgi:hypothetical protein
MLPFAKYPKTNVVRGRGYYWLRAACEFCWYFACQNCAKLLTSISLTLSDHFSALFQFSCARPVKRTLILQATIYAVLEAPPLQEPSMTEDLVSPWSSVRL